MAKEHFYIKILGNTSNTTSGASSIELPILGILPSHAKESESVKAWGGTLRHYPRFRKKWAVKFEPFKTVSGSSNDTDDMEALKAILAKPFLWLIKPTTSGYEMPPRWHDATAFPVTGAVFSSAIAVICESSIEMQDAWNTAEETLELTFTKRSLG